VKARASAHSATAFQANTAENGSANTSCELDIDPARPSPASVATLRWNRSARRKPYSPRPASTGCISTITRIAQPASSSENSTIGGAYIQPDWGSAANARPANRFGSQPGMWPSESRLPRKS
jgi:hypothetical protein